MSAQGNGSVRIIASIIDSLKSHPVVLALVLLNVGMMVFAYYSESRRADTRDNNLKLLMDSQSALFEHQSRLIDKLADELSTVCHAIDSDRFRSFRNRSNEP